MNDHQKNEQYSGVRDRDAPSSPQRPTNTLVWIDTFVLDPSSRFWLNRCAADWSNYEH